MLRAQINFLSTITGTGWMYIDAVSREVVKVTDPDGVEVSSEVPYSYECVGEWEDA